MLIASFPSRFAKARLDIYRVMATWRLQIRETKVFFRSQSKLFAKMFEITIAISSFWLGRKTKLIFLRRSAGNVCLKLSVPQNRIFLNE